MSNTNSYFPKAYTIAHSVCLFFYRNPEEEMSAADIAVKWDAPVTLVPDELQRSIQAELITATKRGKTIIYSRGKAMGAEGFEIPTERHAPAAKKAAPEKIKRPLKRLPPLDIKRISFEFNVPLPKSGKALRADYQKLFSCLHEVGMATSPISQDYHGTLSKAASDYAKANGCKFSLRKCPDQPETFRIHRTA